MKQTPRGKDEKAFLFAAKVTLSIVATLIIAAGIDVSSSVHGAKHFFGEVAHAARVSY
ncbi:MAG: hypothetical protein WCL23_01120 [Candidatus Moraniibacteriota bacterium]